MNKSTLRLFNGILVDPSNYTFRDAIPQNQAVLLEKTVQHGYVIDPRIQADKELLEIIDELIGISGEKANAGFHKSWGLIYSASIEQLVAQQIVHYFTTYGFEALEIYDNDTVYLPKEELDIPKIKDDLPLTVIRAITPAELLEKILNLAAGVALSEEVLDDIMLIIKKLDNLDLFDVSVIDNIGNRELQARLRDFYDVTPDDPMEYLRYLVVKLTGESLVIRNKYLIEKIKASSGNHLDHLLESAPEDLASIFLRWKPLFLAMKSISDNKWFFNKLRRQAVKQHIALPVDYLNTITSQLKQESLNLDTLEKKLESTNIFRKIRLANALKFRLNTSEANATVGVSRMAVHPIVYQVCNGRGWVTCFEWSTHWSHNTREALSIVIKSIAKTMTAKVKDKKVFIPPGINYTLPATEKQYTGVFPNGSSVAVPENMVCGINWKNTDGRVDLDMSVISGSGKIGWDTAYRSGNRSVLFSGDITDAGGPNGATELFFIKKGVAEPRIVMVNYFNYNADTEVATKILVANESPRNFGHNYMVDPNNIMAVANISITCKQNVIGLVSNGRFYFANVRIGASITAADNEQSNRTRHFLVNKLVSTIDLQDVLVLAGAELVQDVAEADIDLSPVALDKTTILELLY